MSTYNRLDLQTLRTQPIMPKNLPDHWKEGKILCGTTNPKCLCKHERGNYNIGVYLSSIRHNKKLTPYKFVDRIMSNKCLQGQPIIKQPLWHGGIKLSHC